MPVLSQAIVPDRCYRYTCSCLRLVKSAKMAQFPAPSTPSPRPALRTQSLPKHSKAIVLPSRCSYVCSHVSLTPSGTFLAAWQSKPNTWLSLTAIGLKSASSSMPSSKCVCVSYIADKHTNETLMLSKQVRDIRAQDSGSTLKTDLQTSILSSIGSRSRSNWSKANSMACSLLMSSAATMYTTALWIMR